MGFFLWCSSLVFEWENIASEHSWYIILFIIFVLIPLFTFITSPLNASLASGCRKSDSEFFCLNVYVFLFSAGTELYRERLVRALARDLQVPLLVLDSNILAPYVSSGRS